jgi:hypothetical protein
MARKWVKFLDRKNIPVDFMADYQAIPRNYLFRRRAGDEDRFYIGGMNPKNSARNDPKFWLLKNGTIMNSRIAPGGYMLYGTSAGAVI